jgi:release factor glutamine methyltransferase
LAWGIDLSEASLAVARGNAVRYGVQGRLQLVRGDLLESVAARPLFDFVLSNPPYVALRDRDRLPALVRREPERALFGGETGLDVLARLIPQAAQRLAAEGFLLLEIGAGQEQAVSQLIGSAGLRLLRLEPDLQGIPRCVIAQRSSERHG